MESYKNLDDKHLFIEIYRSSNKFNELVETICKNYGISLVQLYIIGLSLCSKSTVSSIAKILNLTKSAVSQAIVGLIIKKLVIKTPNLENKKIFYIMPTKKAESIKKDVLAICHDKYVKIIDNMGRENLNLLVNLLHKFNQTINDVSE